ncbi:hypothetical protein RvY_10712-2 [Ramazzottius varieornatus]|uniref:Guanylate cyclase n=1 Tax=Ramazzottius varieornatus TaxID=947166 RepID=A0A1D1VFQ1_RAMVA|nr:hypothetical protein RvY_10712-2 [Ramazzottius varieornatus]
MIRMAVPPSSSFAFTLTNWTVPICPSQAKVSNRSWLELFKRFLDHNIVLGFLGIEIARPTAVAFGILAGIAMLAATLRKRIQRFTGLAWVVSESQMQFIRSNTITIGKFVLPDRTSVRGATMLYSGRLLACCCSFPIYAPFEEVKKNSLAKLVLKLSRDLDHPNISKFYGIMWTSNHPYFGKAMLHVSEMTSKGFLRTIVDDDAYALNWDLRFCLMWDLFLGLRYIHSSKLRFHGSLTSLCTFVDERFTLKINGTGILPYFGTILIDKVVAMPDYKYEVSTMMVNLWMAPEFRQDLRTGWSAASDAFSFGVLLYEMSTRNAPFNVNLCDLAALTEFTRQMRAGTYVPSPAELELDTVPPDIATLMMSCWAINTAERPDLNQIFETLTKVYPQRSGMSFSASIVDRLMHYSNELEEKVREQTDSLRAEADRVDNLLRDLLPYDIVRRLRCGETIQLEQCDSASVLFTDVPVFSDIVGKVTPFQLFTLLEHMCRILDVVVAGFTVFKVETIRDSYMIVAGVPVHIGGRHAVEVANLALAMITSVRSLPTVQAFHLEEWMKLEARAGIHSGPLIAGIVGTKLPHYTVFGDTVNTASRMETTGEASRVHISQATFELLKGRTEFKLEARGLISVKGKGEVETFWLDGRSASDGHNIDLDLNERTLVPGVDPKPATRRFTNDIKTGTRSSAYLLP